MITEYYYTSIHICVNYQVPFYIFHSSNYTRNIIQNFHEWHVFTKIFPTNLFKPLTKIPRSNFEILKKTKSTNREKIWHIIKCGWEIFCCNNSRFSKGTLISYLQRRKIRLKSKKQENSSYSKSSIMKSKWN